MAEFRTRESFVWTFKMIGKLSNRFLSILLAFGLSLQQLYLYSCQLSHLMLSSVFKINDPTLLLVSVISDCTFPLFTKDIIVFSWHNLAFSYVISDLSSGHLLLLVKLLKKIVDLFRGDFFLYKAVGPSLKQMMLSLYYPFFTLTSLWTINCFLPLNSLLHLISIVLILHLSFVLNLLYHFVVS